MLVEILNGCEIAIYEAPISLHVIGMMHVLRDVLLGAKETRYHESAETAQLKS